jgi:hypothetical protein
LTHSTRALENGRQRRAIRPGLGNGAVMAWLASHGWGECGARMLGQLDQETSY